MPPTTANQITGGSQYRLITNSAMTPRMLPIRLRLYAFSELALCSSLPQSWPTG